MGDRKGQSVRYEAEVMKSVPLPARQAPTSPSVAQSRKQDDAHQLAEEHDRNARSRDRSVCRLSNELRVGRETVTVIQKELVS